MTSFDTVIDLALVTVNDYRISKLYAQCESKQDFTDFHTYVDGFLIRGVSQFTDCRQSLEYDTVNRQFISDLTSLEMAILADLWAIEWYTRDNNTTAWYRMHLQNTSSFKNHSEAQNLKEHSTELDKKYEELNRKLTRYQTSDLSSYF